MSQQFPHSSYVHVVSYTANFQSTCPIILGYIPAGCKQKYENHSNYALHVFQ